VLPRSGVCFVFCLVFSHSASGQGPGPGANALYDKMFEGASDAVTITVELFCARGLSSRDGKCDAYPKVRDLTSVSRETDTITR
jgi:hypothetical protein